VADVEGSSARAARNDQSHIQYNKNAALPRFFELRTELPDPLEKIIKA
jgi:hypothetical protein